MPNPVLDSTTAIASAISEGFKLIGQIISGAESRRMRAAIEQAERCILRWREITPENKRDKLMASYAQGFFKYNN